MSIGTGGTGTQGLPDPLSDINFGRNANTETDIANKKSENKRFWVYKDKNIDVVVDLSKVTSINNTGRNMYAYYYNVVIDGALISLEGQGLIKQYKEYHGLS